MQVTLPKCDVLCVYGFPEPQLYEELQAWLLDDEGRFLIIIEDDEQVLLGASSPGENVRVCHATREESLKAVAWEFVFLSFDYYEYPGNSLKDPAKIKAFSSNAISCSETSSSEGPAPQITAGTP